MRILADAVIAAGLQDSIRRFVQCHRDVEIWTREATPVKAMSLDDEVQKLRPTHISARRATA
jgi:hypothetical protein